jgi:hypothetical protein
MREGLAGTPGVYVYDLQAVFSAWIRHNGPLSSRSIS